MEPGNRPVRSSMRMALPAMAIIAAAAVPWPSAQAADAPLPVVVTSAPAGCKDLGEVLGKHQDMVNPSVERAQEYALKDARDLGATHVKAVGSGQRGKTAFFRGIAFRCPAPPAPPQGK